MISGAHMMIYSADAEADRAFFRDVLGFPSVDAGEGWLIFALPPAEIACSPRGRKWQARDLSHVRQCGSHDSILGRAKGKV